MQKGGFVKKSLGRLTYDVSRLIAKGYARTIEEARALIRESLVVMEHPKLRRVRKRDVDGNIIEGHEMKWIWWSAHWRGGTEEEKRERKGKPVIAPRQAQAVLSHPERELVAPVLDDVRLSTLSKR